MNVNVKVTLTDEERNVMFRRLTGKNGKGMVSRAEVNQWVKDNLERFLTLGSPVTEGVIFADTTPVEIPYDSTKPIVDVEEAPPVKLTDEQFDDLEQGEVEYLITQNKLLQGRVNRLQHMIDTRGLKD